MNGNVTRHGEKRVRERVGVPKRAVGRRAEAARQKGLKHEDAQGSLRKYLDTLYMAGNADEIRIYAGYIYIFCGGRLITCLVLPREFCRRKRGIREEDDEDYRGGL